MKRGWIRWSIGPVAAVASAGAGVVFASPLWAGTASAYGPTACTPSVSTGSSSVAAGGSITVSVTGSCTSDTFTAVLHSTSATLGTLTTGTNGTGSATFTVPSNLTSGTHTLTVSDPNGNSASTTVTVTGGAASSSAPLPITGTDSAPLVAIGAAAVGFGGLLVLGARRRRRHQFS
ncbi:MAG TPA: LPXTG cell wall anchor domain-containing protein [Acidimicrobiales bacterium]